MQVKRKPVVKDFKLDSDPEGKATVTIRQARTGDTSRRGELFAETTRIWNDEDFGQVQLKQKWNIHEQRLLEAQMTVVCVLGIEDEEGNPLFRTHDTPDGPRLRMSAQEFEAAWNLLPDDVSLEIHRYILEVNPQWKSNAAGE